MMPSPPYFEEIRRGAQSRWDQLEADPEIAAPWHQLFKQVQSPRHVVSELLQNADDAGATFATVDIHDGEFIFGHNGEDFQADQFASLCRFGYSNKRHLHTIGFRGIGFKSTFSLGNEVKLRSPSLSVVFRRKRFTEPEWSAEPPTCNGRTFVSVKLQDVSRATEMQKNISAWTESPTSLLFFRSLRGLRLGGLLVEWRSDGVGPVPNSEWIKFGDSGSSRLLLIRSEPEEFPSDAVEEIRQERMLGVADEADMPPCTIDIVVGIEGRLFVVLPTGVTTPLPFACNAPFIQDPARVKIKDPETSPTNRWLLERAGKLAARTMMQWLGRKDMPIAQRAEAYRLLPLASSEGDTIEDACVEFVSNAFSSEIEDQPILLTNSGELATKETCIAVPTWLSEVWDDALVSTLFDSGRRPLFCNEVGPKVRSRLIKQGYLTSLDDGDVHTVLRNNHLPRPKSWKNLLNLWAAVALDFTEHPFLAPLRKDFRIVPVQAQDNLYSAQEVVRLGEKKLLHSEADWDFLSKFLLVMNPNWPRFLAEQRRNAEADQNEELARQVQAADSTLSAIGLGDSNDAAQVIEQVATAFFGQEQVTTDDCIRLAQIAAKLSVQASPDFEFVTLDGTRRSRAQGTLIADSRFDFDTFATERWCDQHVIYEAYSSRFVSCTGEDWQQWITSGRSGLAEFIPLRRETYRIWGEQQLKTFLKQRGQSSAVPLPYNSSDFEASDWDFPEEHWQHWEHVAKEEPNFWVKLTERLLAQPSSFWKNALTADVSQIARNRSERRLNTDNLLPRWIEKLRQKECLQDTWGKARQPVDLLCRTPETESLLDIEPFVKAAFDTEAVRPLLARLGVRDTPTGPDRLLDRLKALAAVTNPPVFEVEKWCHRIDGMLPKCSTEEFEKVKATFQAERLVLTTDGTWAQSNEVFLAPDDHDVPGAALVHEAIRSLTLWQKVGVEPRPTLDRIIEWLQSLPQDEKLAPDVLRRIKELLPRHAHRIWFDCGCWLNLDGEWTSIENLKYSISMHSLSAWGHLFPAIKKQVADLQRLTADVVHDEPFSSLPSLASCLSERVQTNLFAVAKPAIKGWLQALGAGLSRIVTDSEERTSRIRDQARRLATTMWQTTTALETVPYIDGTPAGTARANEVLWEGQTLYVVDRPVTRLLRQIAREVARPFDDTEIEDCIKFCIDRTPDHVTEYLEQNFTLAAPQEAPADHDEKPIVAKGDGSPQTDDVEPVDRENLRDEVQETKPETLAEEMETPAPEPEGESSAAPDDAMQEDSDGETAATPEDDPAPIRNPTQRPKLLSILDRFAEAEGFKREATGERYFHSDGRWLQKQNGQPFPWGMFSSEGYLLRSLLARDHCLIREPLQIACEIWDTCKKAPDSHSLIVEDIDGRPQELTGATLVEMANDGKLLLYPATYRVVCKVDEAHPSELLRA